MSEELDKAIKLIHEAIREARKTGWTQKLREQYILGVGMEENVCYGECTIIQHFFINEDEGKWEEYADGETWDEYINSEFKDNYTESDWEKFV